MASVTTSQIRKIYAMSKELGMDNELLHSFILNVTGMEHISKLTKYEAIEIIDRLETIKSGKPASSTYRYNMATQGQIYMIKSLEKSLGWDDNPRRLKGFMKKYTGVEELNWLTFKKASNLIEALKKVMYREKRKCVNGQ